jgi:hypothetical protein
MLVLFGLASLAPVGAAADPGAGCSVAWGAFVAGTPASLDPLTQLEGQVGQPAAIVHWSQGWQPDDNPTLDPQQMQTVRGHGSWPFISWRPQGVLLAEITGGQRDDLIDRWAAILADYEAPVLLAPLAQMDDPRHSYAIGAGVAPGTNTPEDLVAAWRHIHDRFANAGASNVLWVFEVAGMPEASLATFYPGSDQVDWLAMDVYNAGPAVNQPWTSLADLVDPVYKRLEALSGDKPVMLAEVGSVEDGGDKAQWLRDAGTDIPAKFPQVKAVVYFNAKDPARPELDWRLETSLASLSAAHAAFGPGTPYCLTAADLAGSSPSGPGGPFRRTLSLAIPLLALTAVFIFAVGASKMPRPRF